MRNVQVIDGAENCTYDIFAITDEALELLFPDGCDIEFVEDFASRVGESAANRILQRLWSNRIDKKDADGIHGTLFVDLVKKKKRCPTKRDSEAENPRPTMKSRTPSGIHRIPQRLSASASFRSSSCPL